MKPLHPREIEGVLALDAPSRYQHLVKQVADKEELWSLRADDGWVAMGDDAGNNTFPVWPHPDYARMFATGDWASATPTAIALDDWLDEWLPNLDEQGDKVAVFPTPAGQGVVVEPAQIRADLERELEQYE